MSNFSITRRSAMKIGLGGIAMPFIVTGASAAPKVTLRMASGLPADMNSSHYVWFERFQSNLKNAVGDAIAINYFPNGQLGKEGDMVQQVRLGAVDMMVSGVSYWASLVPEYGVLDLGYLFNDETHVARALDGKAGTALADLLLKKTAIHTLGYAHSLGARNVYTSKPIAKPEDLHGVKIRVLPVPNFIATLKAMGAVPIPLPLGELYTALQTGVVDGLEQDAPTVLSSKFYEVAKYCTLTRHIYNPIVAVIGKRAMDRIPAEHHEAVRKAAQEACVYQRGLATATEAKAFEQLKSNGLQVAEIDRAYFRKVLQPVWESFSSQYPDTRAIIADVQAVAS